MNRLCLLKNPILEYAWGSRTALAELLNEPIPSAKPQAELWMGAHYRAPSLVLIDGQWLSLLELIESRPVAILGESVAGRFRNRLPFLFKVLAVDSPLSVQAHPDIRLAREGFALENKLGIHCDAYHRCYRDDNHKPELICALTTFCALNGFRRIEQILDLLGRVCIPSLAPDPDVCRRFSKPELLKTLFSKLTTLDKEEQYRMVSKAVQSAAKLADVDDAFKWMVNLNELYPGDVGVVFPLLLNLVVLRPGEAMFIQPGDLHTYLRGVGIEVMANSDNVLRGGLTSKHTDTAELSKVVNFSEKEVFRLTPAQLSTGEVVYATTAEEFVLSVIFLTEANPFISAENRSIEILICTEGTCRIEDPVAMDVFDIRKGTAILIPAALRQYRMAGRATVYRASVPPFTAA
jgi:mannose-6-phosphate isomerase